MNGMHRFLETILDILGLKHCFLDFLLKSFMKIEPAGAINPSATGGGDNWQGFVVAFPYYK